MFDLTDILSFWNEFFYSPTPVHTVAIFRIVLGSILLCDAVYTLVNIKDFLGPQGLLNHERFEKRSAYAFSLFRYLPATMWTAYAVLGLHVIALILMILGLFTTFSIILVYLTLGSIIHRNPAICNGGDNVSRIMCFYLIFASSGQTYSLDEYLFYSVGSSDKDYLLQAPWAIRLMQIQLSVIYLKTVYWKLRGATYRNGTAMYYVMANHNYRRFSLPAFLLKKPYVQLMSWGALIAESGIALGLWINESRNFMIATGFGLHLGIEYILNVHLFSWYMMAVLVLFIDSNEMMLFINHISDQF